jgi:hypothetical protein
MRMGGHPVTNMLSSVVKKMLFCEDKINFSLFCYDVISFSMIFSCKIRILYLVITKLVFGI